MTRSTASLKIDKSRTMSASLLAMSVAIFMGMNPAHALSELQPGETPPTTTEGQTPAPPADGNTVPSPDPIRPPATDDGTTTPPAPAETPPTDEVNPDGDLPATPDQPAEAPPPISEEKSNIARPDVDPDGPLPEIQHDVTKLPEPVQRMRKMLVEAASSGDIEKLRAIIGTDSRATLLSLTELTPDPIVYLKSQSGDDAGREILAILEEVLEAGYVHLNAGTPQELYVWPYFFAMPLDKLSPQQMVELFKIITGGEYEEMSQYGSYLFYRVGITPAGEWAFFVSGE